MSDALAHSEQEQLIGNPDSCNPDDSQCNTTRSQTAHTATSMALLCSAHPSRLLSLSLKISSGRSRAPRFLCNVNGRLLCNAAAASEKDILRGVQPDNKDVVARISEMAENASERWSVAVSPFLEPPAMTDAMMVRLSAGVDRGHVVPQAPLAVRPPTR